MLVVPLTVCILRQQYVDNFSLEVFAQRHFFLSYMHHWSLNSATMSTLVTELAECCAQVTKLGKDEQTGHNHNVAR